MANSQPIELLYTPQLGIPSLRRILPYEEFLDDCVILNDGTIGMAVRYFPIVLEGKPVDEIAHRLVVMERAMSVFAPQVSVQFMLVRDSDATETIDGLDRQISELTVQNPRRATIIREMLENRKYWFKHQFNTGALKNDRHYMFVSFKNFPSRHVGMHEYMNYLWGAETTTLPRKLHDNYNKLRVVMNNIMNTLSECGMQPVFLDGLEIANIINRLLNFLRPVGRIGRLTDDVLKILYANEYKFDKEFLFCNGRYGQVLSLIQKPIIETDFDIPSVYASTYGIQCDYYTTYNIDFPDKEATEQRMGKMAWQAGLFAKAKGMFVGELFNKTVTQDDINARQEKKFDRQAEEAQYGKDISEMQGKRLVLGELLTAVFHIEPEKTEANKNYFTDRYNKVYNTFVRQETVQGLYCWVSTLPFCGYRGLRKNTDTLGNCLRYAPVAGAYYGSRPDRNRMTFANRWNGIVHYNPFDVEGSSTYYHKVVVGRSGSGKTLNPDSMVQLRRARGVVLCRIRDVEVGDEIRSVNMFTGEYEWQRVDNVYNFEEPCFDIRTERYPLGMKFTPTHRFAQMLYNREAGLHLNYIHTADAKVGTHVAVPVPQDVQGMPAGTDTDRRLGYFIGCLVGDGCYTEARKGVVSFTNGDEHVLCRVEEIAAELGFTVKRKPTRGNAVELTFQSAEKQRQFFEQHGLVRCRAEEKHIPFGKSGKYTRAWYLGVVEGLLDTDGFVDEKKSTIEFSTASRELAQEFLFVLQSVFGLYPFVRVKPTGYRTKSGERKRCLDAHIVSVSSYEYDLFFSIFQLCPAKHRPQVGKERNTNRDIVPWDIAADVQDELFDLAKSLGIYVKERRSSGSGSCRRAIRFVDGTHLEYTDRFRKTKQGWGRRKLLALLAKMRETLGATYSEYVAELGHELQSKRRNKALKYLAAVDHLTKIGDGVPPCSIQISDFLGEPDMTLVRVGMYGLRELGWASMEFARRPRRHGEMEDMLVITLTDAGRAKLAEHESVRAAAIARFVRMERLLSNYAFDVVSDMRETKAELMDLSVSGNQNFVTEHSVAHNSVMLNNFIYSLLADNCLAYILDVGGSYKKICNILDGSYIAVRGGDTFTGFKCINPFFGLGAMRARLDTARKVMENLKAQGLALEGRPEAAAFYEVSEQYNVRKALCVRILEMMMRKPPLDVLEPKEKGRVVEMVDELEQEFGEKEFTLEDFRMRAAKDPILTELRYGLNMYCKGGPYAGYFNEHHQFSSDVGLSVFDIEGLNTDEFKDLKAVFFVVFSNYLLDQFYQHRRPQKLFLIDEAQEVMKAPETAEVIEKAYRQFRKLNGCVVSASQSIADFDSKSGRAIVGQTAEQMILNSKDVELPMLRSLLGFTDSECDIIRSRSLVTVPGSHSCFYYRGQQGNAVIKFAMPKFEYWLSTNHQADNVRLLEKTREYGGNVLAAIRAILRETKEI